MQSPRLFTPLRMFLFSTMLLLLAQASLTAQTTAARPDRGIMPGASYSVSDIENISLTNGNVQLTIPLAALPPIAGGKLKYTVNAVYNSKLWNVTRQENRLGQFYGCPSWVVDTPQLSDLGGWRIPFGYRLVFRNAHEDFDYVVPAQPPTPDCETDVQEQQRLQSQYYRVILISPDGAEHELRPTDSYAPYGGSRSYLLNYYKDTPTTVGGAMKYYSFDGSYLYAVINPSSSSTSWTVYMNDGTRIVQSSNGIQRITDTNGNSIKIFSDANGDHAQDELTGREIRFYNNRVFYKTVTNIEQSIDITMGSTLVQGKIYQVNDWSPTGGETGGGFVCTRNDLLTTSVPVIREIVFPVTEPGVPARRYIFSYNSDTTSVATDSWHLACNMAPQPYTRTVSNGMGELSQVVTPSGATANYSYSKSSINNFSLDTNDIPRATVTQKQLIHDGITDTWTYNIVEFNDCGGTVTAPDGSITTEQCYPHDPAWARFFGYHDDRGGLTYRSRRSDKEMVERHWTMLPFTGANTNLTGNTGVTTFNPVVDVEYLTLLDDTTNHNPIKMSAKKYQYDFNGNLTQQIDYDWFDPALITSRTAEGVPTGVPAGATVLRTTNYTHYNQAATATSANVYAKRLLSTATPLILNAPRQTDLGSSTVQFSYDGQAFDVAPAVGNLTTKSVFDNLDNKWITTSSTYDVYGNVLQATDGRGKVTQYFYDDTTHALPTRVVVDPQNGTGTQTTTTVYDTATGLVTSVTDPNNAISTINYTNQLLGTIDPFGRPGIAIGPLVNGQHRRVTTTYEDHLLRVVAASDLNSEDDKLLKTRTTSDMLGRSVLVEQTEDGTNYTLYSQQAYAQAGRITLSSSVMRTGSLSSTDMWTRVTNDVLGRVSEVTTFGGAAQPPSTGTTATATGTVATAYDANFTTVTDQAGKVRRSMVDALGRLIRVDEPDAANNLGSTTAPVQPTSYAYDVFGNLTTVTQGSQTRTFTYDSLSRLRTAVNPESGTINYQYDDNGNLVVKTDARVSAHFEYDSLNRVTRRWYNGSSSILQATHNTPALPSEVGATDEVKFFYDTQGLPTGAPSYTRGAAVGRLVAQIYGSGTTGDYYAYDALGRATLKFQRTGSIDYQMSANYNLSGALTTFTYPSNHNVTNTYDQAGRLTALSGNLGDNTTRTYATGLLYSPTGGLVKEQFGTNTAIYNKSFYNSRGQLAEIRVSSSYTGPTDTDSNRGALINSYSDQCSGICSGSAMTDNNGNLKKQDIVIPGATTFSQLYQYDSLNRLLSAREVVSNTEQWKQQFTYDRWGNRTIDTNVTYGAGINNKSFTVNTANNRLGVPGGQSGVMTYDAVGNLTNDTYTGAGNRTYDAENKMTSAWGGNNQAQTYKYDGGGQRIKRTVNGDETWQVYGFNGELLAEYPANGAAANPMREYGYRNGQLLVTSAMDAVWSDDAAPAGAAVAGDGDSWNWVGSSPGPFSGSAAHQSNIVTGLHQHYFYGATATLSVNAGDKLVAYVYLDPGNLPSQIMLQWAEGSSWEHRAYWGANNIPWGTDGTNSRRYMGPLPAAGSWVRLEVPANLVGLEGLTLHGMAFSMWGGRATWDRAGKTSSAATTGMETVWSQDAAPAGAAVAGDGDSWNWVSSNPGPFSGTVAHQSNIVTGLHQHYFYGATATLSVNAGDKLLAYVYLDPSNMPSQIMLQWAEGSSWEHRAYWGANNLPWGTDGTNSRRYMGPLPAAGSWVRLEVPANLVGLEGLTLHGMAFSMWGGRATWDLAGKTSSALIGSSLQWLVSDQLGTPRIIIDQTGDLVNVKRHDYLPFGEELFAPTGGRSTTQGYLAGDGIRQQFTQKERDTETGLDYFLARYYSSTAGRFMGSDPGSFTPTEPQNFNRYSYAQNNPLKFIDRDGKDLYFTGADADYIVSELEKFTGLHLVRDPTTGKVTIAKSSKRKTKGTSTWFANRVQEIIGDSRAAVAINTGRSQPLVFFDSYEHSQLDVDDYNALKSADPKFAAESLAHVIEEYYYEQIIPLTDLPEFGFAVPAGGSRGPLSRQGRFAESHAAASEFESKVLSDFTGWWEKPFEEKPSVSTPAGTVVTFEFSTVTYDVLIKNNAAGSPNVVSVTKHEKRKPRKY